MGSISKHSLNTETSSEESEHQPEKFKEESTGIGRFYECNFCKRGFTNAQALGGHMNIHRKDRAKVKQKTSKSSSLSKSGEECMNPRYFEHLSSDHQRYFAVPMGSQMNNQFYFPTSNPNFPPEYDFSHLSDLATLRKDNLNLPEDHETANLSMQIDYYSDHHQEASEGRNTNWKENELDLELRLG